MQISRTLNLLAGKNVGLTALMMLKWSFIWTNSSRRKCTRQRKDLPFSRNAYSNITARKILENIIITIVQSVTLIVWCRVFLLRIKRSTCSWKMLVFIHSEPKRRRITSENKTNESETTKEWISDDNSWEKSQPINAKKNHQQKTSCREMTVSNSYWLFNILNKSFFKQLEFISFQT